jgi:HAD superfamily hydrolase (TIGR01490 family)
MMQKKTQAKNKKLAVFDIDGTIFRSSLLIELVEELIAEQIFPAKARAIYARAYQRWLDRKDSYDKYIWAVVEAFETHIKGVPEKRFLQVVKRVNSAHKDRVYRYTRDLVRDLKRKGYFMLAISHSPKYIVEGFAKQLGFNKVYGRYLLLDKKGRLTGETLNPELIGDKANALLRAVEKERLTLKGSWGVGDTESDIKFLELVDNPVCFNPNSALYKAAKKRGWKIVVERKDVIYTI